MLPYGEQFLCDVGKRQENLPRNRYKAILPCTLKKHFNLIIKILKEYMYKTDFIDINESFNADEGIYNFFLITKMTGFPIILSRLNIHDGF